MPERPRISSTTISSAFLLAALSAHKSASCSGGMGTAPVELILLDDATDSFRYQILYREPACNAFSDFCARKIEPPFEARMRFSLLDPGPVQHHKPHQPLQFRVSMPG